MHLGPSIRYHVTVGNTVYIVAVANISYIGKYSLSTGHARSSSDCLTVVDDSSYMCVFTRIIKLNYTLDVTGFHFLLSQKLLTTAS
jgi:hypothetical protein